MSLLVHVPVVWIAVHRLEVGEPVEPVAGEAGGILLVYCVHLRSACERIEVLHKQVLGDLVGRIIEKLEQSEQEHRQGLYQSYSGGGEVVRKDLPLARSMQVLLVVEDADGGRVAVRCVHAVGSCEILFVRRAVADARTVERDSGATVCRHDLLCQVASERMAGDVEFIAANSHKLHLVYRPIVERVRILFLRGFVSVVPVVESDDQVCVCVCLPVRLRPSVQESDARRSAPVGNHRNVVDRVELHARLEPVRLLDVIIYFAVLLFVHLFLRVGRQQLDRICVVVRIHRHSDEPVISGHFVSVYAGFAFMTWVRPVTCERRFANAAGVRVEVGFEVDIAFVSASRGSRHGHCLGRTGLARFLLGRQGSGVTLEPVGTGPADFLDFGRVEHVMLARTAAYVEALAECVRVCGTSNTGKGLIHRIKDRVVINATFVFQNVSLSIIIASPAHGFAFGCQCASIICTSTDLQSPGLEPGRHAGFSITVQSPAHGFAFGCQCARMITTSTQLSLSHILCILYQLNQI